MSKKILTISLILGTGGGVAGQQIGQPKQFAAQLVFTLITIIASLEILFVTIVFGTDAGVVKDVLCFKYVSGGFVAAALNVHITDLSHALCWALPTFLGGGGTVGNTFTFSAVFENTTG